MLWFYANNDNYRSDMIWLYEFAAFQILHGKRFCHKMLFKLQTENEFQRVEKFQR